MRKNFVFACLIFVFSLRTLAADEDLPKVSLGEWKLRFFAMNGEWGVPVRNDALLTIKDSSFSVKFTVVDQTEKARGDVHREFEYKLPGDPSRSLIDVAHTEKGVEKTGRG